MSEHTYPLAGSLLFWLLWSFGVLVLLLFGSFLLITVAAAPLAGVWNGLAVLAEGWLLFKTARHFVRKDKDIPELLLLAVVAAIGIPLIAFGGCMVVDQAGGSLRIAG